MKILSIPGAILNQWWMRWWWRQDTIYTGKWANRKFVQYRRFKPVVGADMSAGWEY